MPETLLQRLLFFLKMYAILTLISGVFVLLVSFLEFSIYPKSMSQWAWFLVLVAPVSVALGLFGVFMADNKLARRVKRASAETPFSFLRMGYMFVQCIAVICCLGLLYWAGASLFG